MDDVVSRPAGTGAEPAHGEHLVWHQDLICRDERCAGRLRRFPPGELVGDGSRERRHCPACGTAHVVPAFYLVARARADVPLRGPGRTPSRS